MKDNEETPVEEAPVEEAPVENAPLENAPVEESPVEEAKTGIGPREEEIKPDRGGPSTSSMTELLSEVVNLTWTLDDSGAKMAQPPSSGIEWLNRCPKLKAAVDELCKHRECNALHAMIVAVPAGITLPKHRDFLAPHANVKHPCVERWHLAIQTNEDCLFWDEERHLDGDSHMPRGIWCGPIEYWKLHAAKNSGECDMIHLIVDLEKFVPDAKYR